MEAEISTAIEKEAALWGAAGPLRARDFQAIFEALPILPNSDRTALAQRIQFHARWFFSLHRAAPDTPASVMARKWGSLAKACQSPRVKGRKRCRMHGGADGSGAPKGNRNALRHGRFTGEAIARRKRTAAAVRMMWALVKVVKACD